MDTNSIAKGEATLGVKVIRANGTVEEVAAKELAPIELPTELVNEYKALTARMKEIEAVFFALMIKQQGE